VNWNEHELATESANVIQIQGGRTLVKNVNIHIHREDITFLCTKKHNLFTLEAISYVIMTSFNDN